MKTHALIAHAGSLRSTLAGFALLGATVVGGLVGSDTFAPALTAALALLALNCVAALVVHPLLRRRLPLLVAHLALLALVVLVAIGRLSSLDGRFELTQGVPFDGRLLDARRGPLHHDALHRLAFRHDGFDIAYAPGRRRGPTHNRVVWKDGDGALQQAVIGDHRPLVLDGYRIYTSPNKGFAPLLTWQPAAGEPVTGAVHLPSYPANELRQSREWPLPDGREVWVQLQFDETLIDPESAGAFRLPGRHRLAVLVGTQRAELAPGAGIAIDGGTLTYEGLRTWMGYRVSFDPTLPWLLAAALLAALALGLHYGLKFFAPAPTAQVAQALALSTPMPTTTHDA